MLQNYNNKIQKSSRNDKLRNLPLILGHEQVKVYVESMLLSFRARASVWDYVYTTNVSVVRVI